MTTREVDKLRTELNVLRMACVMHDSLPEHERRGVERRLSQVVAHAVASAVDAGDGAQVGALLRDECHHAPTSGNGLWVATMSAAEGRLPTALADTAFPRPPAEPMRSWPRADTPHGPPPAATASFGAPAPVTAPARDQWAPGYSNGARAAHPVPLARSPLLVLVAQIVLWGGPLLAVWLTTTIPYLNRDLIGEFPGGLALGWAVGPRVAGTAIELAPLLLAGAFAARSAGRWLTFALAAAAAGVIDYVFTFASYSTAWVMFALEVALVFAGWLAVRERPVRAYWLLVPVAGVATLWFAPTRAGNWLRDVPLNNGWYSSFDMSAWGLCVFAAAGLIGVFAAVVPGSSLTSAVPGRFAVAGLAAAAVLAGVIGQVGFAPTSPTTSPAAASTPLAPAEQAGSSAGSTPSPDGQDAATAFFDDLENGGATSCDGTELTDPISSYTIGQVSPQTTGGFLVSANVTLADGTEQQVTVQIDLLESGSCAEGSTFNTIDESTPSSTPTATVSVPTDVPSVPTRAEDVPTDAPLPGAPGTASVVPYSDASTTPRTPAQIVEYQPDGLSSAETAAVGDVIAFMARVNQQNFQAAWDDSTYGLTAATPNLIFRHGYRTSRFYQVAFGQPEQLSGGLIVVPARFASRQDPAAQGYPMGVTDCSYWPQYVFVVAEVHGQWLVDTSGRYSDRPELSPLKRAGVGGRFINPIAQRESC